MNDVRVQDLMLPLERYTAVAEEATLKEVFLALEGAFRGTGATDPTRARDFAVLVKNRDGRVLGRLVVWDVLQGLEGQALARVDPLAMVDGYSGWSRPLEHLASRAENLRARDLVRALHKDEYIDKDAGLDEALHRLVGNRFLSLIATHGGKAVGILRVVDVFLFVCDQLRSDPD